VAAVNATNYLEFDRVAMGYFAWRCSCGQSDTVQTFEATYRLGQLHRKACDGHR
jgi:hypothetical protein